jgi:Insect allergen related repeat, nitrile-specifier detoxification
LWIERDGDYGSAGCDYATTKGVRHHFKYGLFVILWTVVNIFLCVVFIAGKKVTTKGMNGLMDDILELLPQDEIVGLFFEKLETSNDFSVFFERIGSGDFERLIDALKVSEASLAGRVE